MGSPSAAEEEGPRKKKRGKAQQPAAASSDARADSELRKGAVSLITKAMRLALKANTDTSPNRNTIVVFTSTQNGTVLYCSNANDQEVLSLLREVVTAVESDNPKLTIVRNEAECNQCFAQDHPAGPINTIQKAVEAMVD